MTTIRQLLASFVIGISILAAPGYASADQSKPEDPRFDTANAPAGYSMVGDLLIARPLGLAATAIGTTAFVVSLPFTLLSNSVGSAAEALVVEPAKMTFTRCLGCTSNEQRTYKD